MTRISKIHKVLRHLSQIGDPGGRGDDKWRRDEILEAKIKKFLAVSIDYYTIFYA